MLKYILKRLLIFVPTLFAISLLTFIMSVNAPGDPVDVLLARNLEDQLSQFNAKQEQYRTTRALLGLDKPVFYFTVTTATQPDTLHRIVVRSHREAMSRLAFDNGGWLPVQQLYRSMRALEAETYTLPWNSSTKAAIRALRQEIKTTYNVAALDGWKRSQQRILQMVADHEELAALETGAEVLGYAVENLEVASKTSYRRYIPRFHWYGANNQYHRWLFGDAPWFGAGVGSCKGVLRGDFGISYQTMQPVNDQFRASLRWTVLISMISLLIAFVTAIPLGVISAVKRGTWVERVIGTKLFVLYSLPNF